MAIDAPCPYKLTYQGFLFLVTIMGRLCYVTKMGNGVMVSREMTWSTGEASLAPKKGRGKGKGDDNSMELNVLGIMSKITKKSCDGSHVSTTTTTPSSCS